jgi:Flp pilus assembly protein TadG
MFIVGEDGTAFLEFTLVAPLLVVSSIYVMDFGLYYFKQMEVQHAAQASAQYAMVNGSAPGTTDFTGNGITITASTQNYYCASSSSPYSLTAAAQNSTCADGSIAGKYITVSSQATYTSFVRYGLFSQSSYTLTGSAMVRVQ